MPKVLSVLVKLRAKWETLAGARRRPWPRLWALTWGGDGKGSVSAARFCHHCFCNKREKKSESRLTNDTNVILLGDQQLWEGAPATGHPPCPSLLLWVQPAQLPCSSENLPMPQCSQHIKFWVPFYTCLYFLNAFSCYPTIFHLPLLLVGSVLRVQVELLGPCSAGGWGRHLQFFPVLNNTPVNVSALPNCSLFLVNYFLRINSREKD